MARLSLCLRFVFGIHANFYICCFAGKAKGRSKKWRSFLQFPHISLCLHLRSERKSLYLAFTSSVVISLIRCRLDFNTNLSNHVFLVDLSYRQIYREPIGRDLFCAFCSSHCFTGGKLSRLETFLRAIVSLCLRTTLSHNMCYNMYISNKISM